MIARPTRLDHFPNTKPESQPVSRTGHKRQPHPGSGDTLKMWLESHNLPVSKQGHENINTMLRATGGR